MGTMLSDHKEEADGDNDGCHVVFNNLVNAVVSGIVSREAQQLPCLGNLLLSQFLLS